MNPTITEEPSDLERISQTLSRAAAVLLEERGIAAPEHMPAVTFELPRNAGFGDFATNIALVLAKSARTAPAALAPALVEKMFALDPGLRELLSEASATAGFINIRLAPLHWQRVVRSVLERGPDFGREAPAGTRVSLEFGSANPTGPLVVVQGRTLSLGASIAAAMRFCGVDVTTEWIVNDAGTRLDAFARSIYARYRQLAEPDYPFPEDGYPADYIVPLAQALRSRDGARWDAAEEREWLPYFARFGRDTMVAEQQATAARFGVTYDRWQSEQDLHDSGALEAGIAALRERALVYEAEGALWMRTTAFGDDKDRVLVRSDGRPTYYAPDVAYHYDKLLRNDRAVLLLGPDHHGYIARLAAIAGAFDKPGAIEVLIVQLMTLVRGGEVVSMSKRAGNVLTLDEIIDEVGVDAARFFFVLSSADSPMTFDLSLAVEQSNENPVFYVQYAHARIASIERRAPQELVARARRGDDLQRLTEPSELALARRLDEFPATVRGVAENLAPYRLARYLRDVAADLHQFYHDLKVLGDDQELSSARLGLSLATKSVLASGLSLLGVSAPERMERQDS